MTTTMNRLPVSTWNPLGVNYAPAAAALPAVPAAGWAKAEALFPALPAGVTAPAAADFGSFAASGMGAETDAWLAANANLVNHLAVTGTADAPVVFETALDADHPHALTYLTIDAGRARRCRGRRLRQPDPHPRRRGCACSFGAGAAAGQPCPPLERRCH